MIVSRGYRNAITTILVGLVAGSLLAGQVVAQDGTGCELEPLELPLFGGTPVAELAVSPEASPAAAWLPESQVVEVLQLYVACVNTGDPTLVWAMFSPRWFASEFENSEEHYLPAFEQMLDRPAEPPAIPLELGEVLDIERLDGGRVAVTATFVSGDEAWTDRLTLAPADGQWLIDEVEPID